uniref:Uncharacterized protein n=1 Tax=Cacopsylla melanoneura TaxID=428564 RepID=A0A8D8ZVQ9_9HEMI
MIKKKYPPTCQEYQHITRKKHRLLLIPRGLGRRSNCINHLYHTMHRKYIGWKVEVDVFNVHSIKRLRRTEECILQVAGLWLTKSYASLFILKWDSGKNKMQGRFFFFLKLRR